MSNDVQRYLINNDYITIGNRRKYSKFPTIWTDAATVVRAVGTETVSRKKIKVRKKVKKRRETLCFFPMFCGSGGSKSRLAKAASAKRFGYIRDEQLPAVVARTTFGRQNRNNTSCSEHFWKLRCRKSARHCGAKHISKSDCEKNTLRPL